MTDDQTSAANNRFDATIGLGSNVGDKALNIDRAIALLTKSGAVRLVAQSKFYVSAPWGVEDQAWFVNAVIAVATELSPRDLLKHCQAVENDMRRVRLKKWGPRIIDVDILTYRDMRVREPDLIIPHPYIAERGFVLVPLKDVAPDTVIDGKTIDAMIAAIDTSDIKMMD